MEKSKAFLEYTAKLLVNNPDCVVVESKTDELGVLLTLHVAKEDMGLIIGKQGATASLLRQVLKLVGLREKSRVNMKIAEPEGGSNFKSNFNSTTRRSDPLDDFRI